MQKNLTNATFDPRQAAFDAVYRGTTYQAVWPQDAADAADAALRCITLRIDQVNPELDAWLASQGETCWAYLTAANPGSNALAAADNAVRQEALVARLTAQGRPFLLGESLADDGEWPAEPSLLVAGLDESAARILATEFGQNAFLAGVRGQAVKLCWTPKLP